MAESVVISALVAKRAELAGELAGIELQQRTIRDQLRALDQTLKLMGYEGDPFAIKPRRPAVRLFERGEIARAVYDLYRERPELRLNRDIAVEIMRRKDWDIGNLALWSRVTDAVKDARKKRVLTPPGSSIPSTRG